jgi:excisionase family DNA binding protein
MSTNTTEATTPRIALSPEEAAEAIGISVASMYIQLRKGQIPSKRMGRRILIPVDFMDNLPSGWSASLAAPSA